MCSYDFRSSPSALALPPQTLQRMIEDCRSVFGKGGGSEKTWWIASDGKARCALEQLALAVFKVLQPPGSYGSLPDDLCAPASAAAGTRPRVVRQGAQRRGVVGSSQAGQLRGAGAHICSVIYPQQCQCSCRHASHSQQTQSIGFHWDKG
jgi:hypothetical protein